MSHGMRAFMVEKAKWKPLEWLSKWKQCSIPRERGKKNKAKPAQILESEVLICTVLSFKSPSWPLEKVGRLGECAQAWRMCMDFCKLNQVVTLVATAIPGVDSLLEQINTSHTRYAVTSLKKMLFPLSLPQEPPETNCSWL